MTDLADALYWQIESSEFINALSSSDIKKVKFLGRIDHIILPLLQDSAIN